MGSNCSTRHATSCWSDRGFGPAALGTPLLVHNLCRKDGPLGFSVTLPNMCR
jgi:hypothetical protein